MSGYMTDKMTTTSNQLWAVTSAVGAGLCFLVLVMIFVVWLHPKSRPCLDRVSWRIVVWALAANMVFAIASAVGGQLTEAGFLCGFSIFVLQLMLQFSSFLLFSIALNLQLVIVHNFHGQQLEKVYIIVSAAMAIILAVPPYASGMYGWDPLESDCWYSNDDPRTRLIWQISTQMLWTALTALGEIIASGTVMIWMLRHNSHMRQTFAFTSTFSGTSSSSSQGMSDTAPHAVRSVDYRRIVLRIALHSTVAGGIHNSTDYNILLLSDFLYGGRAIVYALLAASDPAFIRGTRVLFKHVLEQWDRRQFSIHNTGSVDKRRRLFRSSDSHGNTDGKSLPGPIVHIELSKIVHHDFGQKMSQSSSANVHLNDSDAIDRMADGKILDQHPQQTLPPSNIHFKDPNIHNVSLLHDSMDTDGPRERVVQGLSKQRKDHEKQEVGETAEDSFWKNI
ncbi:hypothetical protein K435DRAFT_797696 [Dendrothele bispora CBS 962.96]|uniref:G-protein coupled receptors family 2 profile 2 domain-containing protein n=1 Tax=Dendrothele bispora (strain CBS 962.96) TaxID=1314807 RepID=A0A4S8M1P7_DENBC|nr:hypothetical protein K435DRAFT_797696 [Dendrothele bispora CBS 962.96]